MEWTRYTFLRAMQRIVEGALLYFLVSTALMDARLLPTAMACGYLIVVNIVKD